MKEDNNFVKENDDFIIDAFNIAQIVVIETEKPQKDDR